MKDKIVILKSKSKAVMLFLICIVFVALSIWYLLDPAFPIIAKLVSVTGIILFGLGFVVFPKMFLDKRPGIVIDESGITDYITKAGMIKWEDILYAEVIYIMSNAMLAIYVKNPEVYLDRIHAKGLRNNYKLVGTPFVIPSSILKIKLKDLKVIINTRLKEYHYAG